MEHLAWIRYARMLFHINLKYIFHAFYWKYVAIQQLKNCFAIEIQIVSLWHVLQVLVFIHLIVTVTWYLDARFPHFHVHHQPLHHRQRVLVISEVLWACGKCQMPSDDIVWVHIDSKPCAKCRSEIRLLTASKFMMVWPVSPKRGFLKRTLNSGQG